jgi:hypothetical protein
MAAGKHTAGLNWQPLSSGDVGAFADFENANGRGRMVVRTVPRRRKNRWCAIFNGRMRTSPKSYSTERRQNFLADINAAKAICEEWASGVTTGELLSRINDARATGAAQ